jgi:hypothetical protein
MYQMNSNYLEMPINSPYTSLHLTVELYSQMKASPGMISATRHVCKSEWAYELSFVWDTKENFGAWKESALREEVHNIYLDGLKDCGIEEDNVYGGARVSDVWV